MLKWYHVENQWKDSANAGSFSYAQEVHMFEKVNPSHPDKLADRIAGALVDMAYSRSTHPRIAVEVLIGHGICNIICET